MNPALLATPMIVSSASELATSAARSSAPMAIRLVIASSQAILREALRLQLSQTGGFQIMAEVGDGNEGVDAARSRGADILVVDVQPVPDGSLDFLRRIDGESSRPRVVLLLSSVRRAEIAAAVRLGARGFVAKGSASVQLLSQALKSVSRGNFWLGKESAPSLDQALEVLDKAWPEPAPRRFGLTARELQIIPLIIQGYSNGDIADRLSISLHTVKHHCTHIYDKIGASNRLELALFAMHHRIACQGALTPDRMQRRTESQSAECPAACPTESIPSRLP